MSRNFPDKSSVKSHGQGPPGASAFSMEPVPETDSEEQVEILDSLPLGALFFGDQEQRTSVLPWPIDDWRAHYPYWKEPCIFTWASIGDCYAMMVDFILTVEAPFPGDQLFDASGLRPELRFHVHQKEGTHKYIIEDRLAGDQQVIGLNLLEDKGFDISDWFAE